MEQRASRRLPEGTMEGQPRRRRDPRERARPCSVPRPAVAVLRAARTALHQSGSPVRRATCSGRVRRRGDEPANALSTIIHGLRTPTARITVARLLRQVRELTDSSAAMRELPFDRGGLHRRERRRRGRRAAASRRITSRPTLDVNGIWGGYIGAGAKHGAAERPRPRRSACGSCPTRGSPPRCSRRSGARALRSRRRAARSR